MCDAKLYFDSARANELLIVMKDKGEAPAELIKMVGELYERLSRKVNYRNYPPETKEDMISFAWYEFLKYAHNYNPDRIKSKNGAYTFITFNAENSFKRVIKQYYKEKNLKDAMLGDESGCEEWHSNYAYNLTNQLDSDEDRVSKLDNWSHDELEGK